MESFSANLSGQEIVEPTLANNHPSPCVSANEEALEEESSPVSIVDDTENTNMTEKIVMVDETNVEDLLSTNNCNVKENSVDLLVEDSDVNKFALEEDCSLAEETATVKDPLSLSILETKSNETSWRKEPAEEIFFSDEEFDEDYTSDSEEEENAIEYLQMMQRRQQMQALKVVGRNGEVKVTHIPAGIKVTRVPESKEARMKREQELARRKEQARKDEIEPSALQGEKRKHGEGMTLADVRREDFEGAQDYVDFLQSKMKNISIKHCR